jgi:hypothetical protein
MSSDFRPGNFDIQIKKGDTWQEVFALTLNAAPINLTGSTITITIKNNTCDNNTVLTFSNGSGITIGGVSSNNIIIKKDITLDAKDYVWELKILATDNTTRTYLWGNFIVDDNFSE